MSIVLSLKLQKSNAVLRGHDHFWSVIMGRHRTGQTFSVRDIDLASNADTGAVRDFVQRLEKARLIEAVGDVPTFVDRQWRPVVVQTAAPRVRRDGSIIESQPATRCMWNLMRGPMGRSGFTYLDLVHWSQTEETRISANTAKSYIGALNRAGYLIRLDPGKPGTPAIWRLDPAMNTGPQAPMILRTKLVFDANQQKIMGDAEAEEVSA